MFQPIPRPPAPVRVVQQALRTIYPDSTLTEDGIYGTETRALVQRFQQENNLPVSGTVDLNTWNAIRRSAKLRQVFEQQAEPLQIILQPNQVIERGSTNVLLFLVQAMLKALSRYYNNIPDVIVTGQLDAQTANSISHFQQSAKLPTTGEVDKNTWRHLARHFRLAVGDGTGTLPTRTAPKGPEDIRTSQ